MMELPRTMSAMVLTRHGGLDAYEWHEDWPVPVPGPGEVLIRVAACGLNNTDVNTRVGWYSKAVKGATADDASDQAGDDPGWGGALDLPRIQGADVCGRIVAVGDGVDPGLIGKRVIVDCWLRDREPPGYLGSERDGGFAEYCAVPAVNVAAIDSDLSDAELATFSCSYATALGMLTRAEVGPEDTVLVTGASGGVGGALVQIAKAKGARVVALASESKHEAVAQLGPDALLERAPADLQAALEAAIGAPKVSVVADIVGGPYFPTLIDALARRGRYVTSGAIAGPIVDLDLRTLYLQDLTLYGSTVTPPEIFRELVRLIETGAIRPVLAATYSLRELREAQTAFMEKRHVGNIVVTP